MLKQTSKMKTKTFSNIENIVRNAEIRVNVALLAVAPSLPLHKYIKIYLSRKELVMND